MSNTFFPGLYLMWISSDCGAEVHNRLENSTLSWQKMLEMFGVKLSSPQKNKPQSDIGCEISSNGSPWDRVYLSFLHVARVWREVFRIQHKVSLARIFGKYWFKIGIVLMFLCHHVNLSIQCSSSLLVLYKLHMSKHELGNLFPVDLGLNTSLWAGLEKISQSYLSVISIFADLILQKRNDPSTM